MLSGLFLLSLSLSQDPVVLAHYMPWYETKEVSGKWGWHWTMNHFNPENLKKGRREIASKLYPLIGPYDSSDPDALECQVLLMKFAGIDGAMIDWYGIEDVYDYAIIHKNTLKMISALKKAGLKFAITYEDQTLPNLIKYKKVEEDNAVEHGVSVVNWVAKNWFKDPAYVRLNGKPVLNVFGPQFFKPDQWKVILQGHHVVFYGVNDNFGFADGGFSWPYPKGGLANTEDFYENKTKKWKSFMAGAYPRFVDIYEEAKVHDSWGTIPDNDGKTFEKTLEMAVASKSPIIQIATWNDWGEGTSIEPSVEYGYRDLERLQAMAKKSRGKNFAYTPADLRLPVRLYLSRKEKKISKGKLDLASKYLFDGKTSNARTLIQ